MKTPLLFRRVRARAVGFAHVAVLAGTVFACDTEEDAWLEEDEEADVEFRSALDDAITAAATAKFEDWLLAHTDPDKDGLGGLSLGHACEGAEICGAKPPDESVPVCTECTVACEGSRDASGVFTDDGECRDLDRTFPETLRFNQDGKQYEISVTVLVRLDYAAMANLVASPDATGVDPDLFAAMKLRWHIEVTFANAAREVGTANTIAVNTPKQTSDYELCTFTSGRECLDGETVETDAGTGTGAGPGSGSSSGSSSGSGSGSGSSSGSGSGAGSGAGSGSGSG